MRTDQLPFAYLWGVPDMLLYAAAIAIALRRWKKHPQVSLLVVIWAGIALLRVIPLIHFFYGYLPAAIESESGEAAGRAALLAFAVEFLAYLVSALTTILAYTAVFGWRPKN